MKGYKGGNKKMSRNYILDISGKLKEKVKEKSKKGIQFRFLTFEELVAKKGEIVYAMYQNGMLDQAVVYEANDESVTLWGTYDLNGDAFIAIIPKKQYGVIATAAIEVDSQPVIANEETLKGLNFPEVIIKTVLGEHTNDKVQQISKPED